jgi:hypothetical protein
MNSYKGEINNMNCLKSMKEIESVIKNISKKKTLGPKSFNDKLAKLLI